MYGDNQHRADEVPLLITSALKGEADLVIGSRFIKQTEQTETTQVCTIPRYRRFGINVIAWLFNVGSNVKVSDSQ